MGGESPHPNPQPEFTSPEFGSEEYLESLASEVNNHLDKLAGKYPEVDSAVAEFKAAITDIKVDDANYAVALDKVITSLSNFDSKLPEEVLYPWIGDLKKDLITLRML